MVTGDTNCHTESTRDGIDAMGCLSCGVKNQDDENTLRLCQEHNLRAINSYYPKRAATSHYIQE